MLRPHLKSVPYTIKTGLAHQPSEKYRGLTFFSPSSPPPLLFIYPPPNFTQLTLWCELPHCFFSLENQSRVEYWDTVFDPISLTCGHIYCYMCACSAASVNVVDGLKTADSSEKCPLCREVCVYKGAVNLDELNILLKRSCREYWEERHKTERAKRLQQAKEYWELGLSMQKLHWNITTCIKSYTAQCCPHLKSVPYTIKTGLAHQPSEKYRGLTFFSLSSSPSQFHPDDSLVRTASLLLLPRKPISCGILVGSGSKDRSKPKEVPGEEDLNMEEGMEQGELGTETMTVINADFNKDVMGLGATEMKGSTWSSPKAGRTQTPLRRQELEVQITTSKYAILRLEDKEEGEIQDDETINVEEDNFEEDNVSDIREEDVLEDEILVQKEKIGNDDGKVEDASWADLIGTTTNYRSSE
ncbi:hypothetical protein F2Q70_00042894 [Brassica cretica]|uniref:RING-type domain-containing protein n=1 Tax=Brassica cretica TaxID=69181 RepID=A0A8S9KMB8_BRACR|nr:hypothetical protein F2Q70_00042894 [Brassica cretica]